MAQHDPGYTATVNFDRDCMGLDNFDELPTYSLEDVIIETFPDWKHTERRRIYPHVEWLATHIAGIQDRHGMVWTMRVWRDTLLELGYSVDMMVAGFRVWHEETVLAHPGRVVELERDRRAMEEAMEVPVPPPSPGASTASPAAIRAPAMIVISDDEEGEIFQRRKTSANAENESASEDWGGLILEGGGFPEPPQTGEHPGPFYLCKRCSVPGHFIEDCPTNLLPAYDRPPPKDYRCAYCGSGEHFITACPRNYHPDSLNQLRIRAGLIPPTDDRDPSPTIKVVEMAKNNTKDVSGGARIAPSLVDTSENHPIEGSRDQSQSGSVRRRSASPRGRNGKHRSRSPLRDRGTKPESIKAARMAPSNPHHGGRALGTALYPCELNYDDEPMDEADGSAASPQNNSSRILLLRNRQQAEGRLSFYDEGDSRSFGEPRVRRGRAFARDSSESPDTIKSRKAPGRLSFNDYDEGEVEMVDFSTASESRNKKASHFVESSDVETVSRRNEEPVSSTLVLTHSQRQNACNQPAEKPAKGNTEPDSHEPASQDQKTGGNRSDQVVEKPSVFVLGPSTNGMHPQRQSLMDGELAPANDSTTTRRVGGGAVSFQSPNQGIHPDRLNYIKSQSPMVDSDVEAPRPIWNLDGTYNHVRNPDPRYADRVEDWIHNVVNEFLQENNIIMSESPVTKVDAKTPVKKIRFLDQSPEWIENKARRAPGAMKNYLLAAITKSQAEPIVAAKKTAAAAAAGPEENPNIAKALDLLKGSRNPNNRKDEARPTAIHMWDESDCAKPAVVAAAVQGNNEDITMTGMETTSAGPTNATVVLQSIEEASELDCNMTDLEMHPIAAGTSGNATEHGAENVADESVTLCSIEAMSQLSLSLSPPTMQNASRPSEDTSTTI
ncbi:hypothetical protein QBC34DRAFT_80959 [Podospora aff. communis PSN243]|uniref:CCHC-type domain-containing protein n=1 Tax=Podospora aff. communis PSN243 TaxID=3040156 RepID=A0AAV9GNY3_9PEZI|nr:hypothetical protein QBC34DRAFT_80959 [Podospora aff. communis PSN243]